MYKVVFRKWKDGDVIALFPDIVNPCDGTVTSYMHIGQHGSADYTGIIAATNPASETDYRSLLHELRAIGYNSLKIVRRYRKSLRT